jgi:4-carboxymuconolactone decarboxylase
MAVSQTFEERQAKAAESYAVFMPGVDPATINTTLVSRLGALGSMAYDIVGGMWARPQLSRRDRSLLVLSILAAQARDEELELHVANGLRNGLTPVEIEEILLHTAAYAGFPAAIASARRVDKALQAALGAGGLPAREAAAAKSDAERDRDAADVLATIANMPGLEPAAGLEMIETMIGGVGVVAYRWAFGDIWCRPQLSRRDRSLVVIAILVNLGATDELSAHASAGLRHGLTREEIEEEVTHLSLYAGIPRCVHAMQTVRAAFAKVDGA